MDAASANIEARTRVVIDAWNRQAVEDVVACYTEDCVYRDPNTRGAVEGRDALRRYLSRLFEDWTMEWTIKEIHPFATGEGGAFLWRAELGAKAGGGKKRVHGMDFVLLRGELIARNEVYFDRAALLA
jgi:nuclear transport factor 2 (NTF2) superfamily protein